MGDGPTSWPPAHLCPPYLPSPAPFTCSTRQGTGTEDWWAPGIIVWAKCIAPCRIRLSSDGGRDLLGHSEPSATPAPLRSPQALCHPVPFHPPRVSCGVVGKYHWPYIGDERNLDSGSPPGSRDEPGEVHPLLAHLAHLSLPKDLLILLGSA